jgi:hypothetical protein
MKIVSPKEFMKSRRPSRFSDSKIIKKSKLNRSILEYHLGTLTSRKQEYEFEEFARKLCQFEICPGLRPQTGPTGGGDGKVDSETTSKSRSLAILCYTGIEKPTNEKWSFAFSAKKDWVTKVKSDVKNISETDRNYKKIFFITNQYAKASKRSEVEDQLSKQYGIEVIIQDKTWVLDKIFGNKREKLAIDELGLGSDIGEEIEVGPLDFQKDKKLDEINKSIEEDVVNQSVNLKTVDDVLDSAILVRELEKPATEINGYFDKAIRFAEDYGSKNQVFSAVYQKAWTTYFWLENFNSFINLYNDVENIALESENISQIERLRNLWTLLYTLSKKTELIDKKSIDIKTKKLRDKLGSFVNDSSYITASMQAKGMLLLMDLILNIDDEKVISQTFDKLSGLAMEANGLIGYPFEDTFQSLNELSDIFTGNEAYERLQEKIVGLISKRKDEISVAEMLYTRGLKYFEKNEFYEAINYLGKALYRFYKKESKDDLVRTLFLISMSYEEVGLLWAARGALIRAAAYATSDFWIEGEINRMQIICYEKLKTIELRLGNVGYALEWHRLGYIMESQTLRTEDQKNKFMDRNLHFGSVLGMLLIKITDEELQKLEYLPDVLFEYDLDFAAYGLIFRLGCHKLLPKEFVKDQSNNDLQKFFDSYLTQPAQDYLPDVPNFYSEKKLIMKSQILGAEFIVEATNKSPEIEFGESFLAAIESFLSTTMRYKAVSRDSQILVKINSDSLQKERIKYQIRKGVKIGIDITCQDFNAHSLTLEEQQEISIILSKAVLELIANSVVFDDAKNDLLKLFKDEEVSYRSFNFSGSFVILGNVLGYNPKRAITDWTSIKNHRYPFVKEKAMKVNALQKKRKGTDSVAFDYNHLKHNEIKNISIIRQHLWDEAGWKGVMYFVAPNRPPILGLMFANKEAAESIFQDWISTFSKEDKNDVIRLSMLRGVSQKHPAWYRTIISTNFKNDLLGTDKVIIIARMHTMNPESTVNLDRFSESFNRFGYYLLAPAYIKTEFMQPKLNIGLGIVKRSFNDRYAWEVGLNDPDIPGILKEDNIFIPKNVKNAPVIKLLDWKLKK